MKEQPTKLETAGLLPPKVLKPIRRKLGIANRVPNVLKMGLRRPGVVTAVGERIATAVPQHVGMHRERHVGPNPDPAEQGVEGFGCHRPVPLGHEHMRGRPLFALKTPQDPVFRPPWSGWTLGEPFVALRTCKRPAANSTCDHCKSHSSEARSPCR
jgi:hypothetical protein